MDKKIVHDSRDSFEPNNLFNGKAALYRYRAHYSDECIEYLCNKYNITSASVVADIGGGTGILAKQIHACSGCRIILVEPNEDMMNEAKNNLGVEYTKFVSATAENTTIDNEIIDLIIVGTAFHWFNMNSFRKECLRIGKQPVSVALLRLYNFVPDIDDSNTSSYHSIGCEQERAESFFDCNRVTQQLFFHDEIFDEERFVYERLSDHNAPTPGDKEYNDFVCQAKKAFAYFGAKTISNVFITSCMEGEIT